MQISVNLKHVGRCTAAVHAPSLSRSSFTLACCQGSGLRRIIPLIRRCVVKGRFNFIIVLDRRAPNAEATFQIGSHLELGLAVTIQMSKKKMEKET